MIPPISAASCFCDMCLYSIPSLSNSPGCIGSNGSILFAIILGPTLLLQMRPRLFYFLFTEFSISEAISVLKNCSIRTASTSCLGFNC